MVNFGACLHIIHLIFSHKSVLTECVGGHHKPLVVNVEIVAEVSVVPHGGSDERLQGPLRNCFWHVHVHDALEHICRAHKIKLKVSVRLKYLIGK